MAAATNDGWDVHYARFDGSGASLDGRPLPDGATSCDWLGSRHPILADDLPAAVDAFGELVARVQPAVVHAGPLTDVAWVATQASSEPVVAMSWASDLLIEIHDDASARTRASEALRGAAAVVVDCATIAEIALTEGADEGRIEVVPWGVDLSTFPGAAMPPPEGPLRLVHVRSLEPLYDPATVLEGVALAVDRAGPDSFHLTLAGGGSLTDELRATAAALGLAEATTWCGRVPEGEMPGLFADHEVHLSAARSDGSSLSLLGAMATGRPSVVADLPSNHEWVRPGVDGWVFPLGDAAALADRLLDALGRRGELAAMGESARSVVEQRADWAANQRRVIELYEAVRRSTDH
ncbi:MAG: glycosyltransferase family 4 protein [Acidimicrobiia bacterium]|nr:glycosyltransferase family 4 protein [Acidimicrobiia bacterium]